MAEAARNEGQSGVPNLTKLVVEMHRPDSVAKRHVPAKQRGKGDDRTKEVGQGWYSRFVCWDILRTQSLWGSKSSYEKKCLYEHEEGGT